MQELHNHCARKLGGGALTAGNDLCVGFATLRWGEQALQHCFTAHLQSPEQDAVSKQDRIFITVWLITELYTVAPRMGPLLKGYAW